MNENERLAAIDARLRSVEQTLASLRTTQRLIGGALLLISPLVTAVLVKVVGNLFG